MKNISNIIKNNNYFFLKFCAAVVVLYFAVMYGIFFLAHDQLFFQETQGYCAFPGNEYAISELYDGVAVREDFEPGMDIINSIEVQVITYSRENNGTLVMELVDTVDNKVIGTAQYDMSQIENMEMVAIALDEPYYMNNHTLSLRMYGKDVVDGLAVAPLIISTFEDEHGSLFLNDKKMDGRLSMSAMGQQTIWAGPHYTQIVFCGLLVVIAILVVIIVKLYTNKTVQCFRLIEIFQKYSFLISQLVGTSFKTKYKRSVLGIFWSFLNPLLTMSVQYIVFSSLFKSNIAYFHIYLLVGITFYSFFSVGVTRSLWSIMNKSSLIKKVYVPKWIYPFSEVMSSFVDFAISLVPLLILVCCSGIKYSKAMWLTIIPIACLFVFTVGLGMLLAALMVFFRDTEHIWAVVSMVWMYLTPTFYSIEIIPKEFRSLFKLNPLYIYITFARTCIMEGISPYPGDYIRCAVSAIVMFAIGASVFKKMQDGFLLRI